MTEVAQLPARQSELRTGGAIKAVVPQSMDDAYRLAKAVCMSGMAPKGYEKPEAAMVAILHGLEIGLTPMMALQKIAVINGRPTLWGDGALGLVRASGLCKYVTETITGTGDARAALCETLRNGEREPIKRTFSVADAKRAGLWDKQGPWKSFPERMLQMRARAFALRDGYADVLGGMYLAEELQGTEQDRTNYSAAPPAPRLAPPPAPVSAPPTAPAQEAQPEPAALSPQEEATLDREAVREAQGESRADEMADWLADQIAQAKRTGTLEGMNSLDDFVCSELTGADREDLRAGWNNAYATRKAELGGKRK